MCVSRCRRFKMSKVLESFKGSRTLGVNAGDDDNDDDDDDDDDDDFEGHGPCVRVKGRSVQGFFASFMASKV